MTRRHIEASGSRGGRPAVEYSGFDAFLLVLPSLKGSSIEAQGNALGLLFG